MTFDRKLDLLSKCKQYPIVIPIKPRPAPRPRGRNFHNPKWYKRYKEDIVDAIKAKGGFPKENYFAIDAGFYIKYPKDQMKKNPEDGLLYRSRGDSDNYMKGILDALQDGEYIPNDRMIIIPIGCQYRCIGDSFITFTLFALSDDMGQYENSVKLLRESYDTTYSLQFPGKGSEDGNSDPLGLFEL